MRSIGLGLPLSTRDGTASKFLQETLAEVQAAEEAGFDLCLIPEHHHGPPVSLLAPLTLASALAAVTTRIRIGPGVLILPVHHPRHLAEQLILVDQLSGGRAVLGVGVGYQADDFIPFGVDPAERGGRFESVLRQIGDQFDGPEALRQRPVQLPRPPLWVGAWSAVGVERAALLADGWIGDPIRTTEEVAAMATRYREACQDKKSTVVVMREAWVDEAPGAMERFASIIEPVFRYYRRHGAASLPDDFATLAKDRFVVGSPDDCAEQIDEVARRTQADTVVVTLRHPDGPGHAATLDAIAKLGAASRARNDQGSSQ